MKYFGFLARFVVIPLLLLRALLWWEKRRGHDLPDSLQNWPENHVLAGHVAVAVAYTTLWDNYLVAEGVWSYDPDLVTGKTIGYVPIEEYSFFVLQTLLAGSWTQLAARYIPAPDTDPKEADRGAAFAATGALAVVWMIATMRLFKDRRSYLDLILSWALVPIMIQTGFGGDILWRHRKLVLTGILPATLYLAASDSVAIGSGTWTINPDNITGVHVISKHLPFEEALFFFLTNVMLVFGVTLVQAKESESRLPESIRPAYERWKRSLVGSS